MILNWTWHSVIISIQLILKYLTLFLQSIESSSSSLTLTSSLPYTVVTAGQGTKSESRELAVRARAGLARLDEDRGGLAGLGRGERLEIRDKERRGCIG
jgi:hypothetical protein